MAFISDELVFSRKKPRASQKLTSLRLKGIPVKPPYKTSQRATVVVHRQGNVSKLKKFVEQYMIGEGKGIDGQDPEVFTDKDREINLKKIPGEKRYFHFMISPENGRNIEMKTYIQDVMKTLERKMDQKLEWAASIHDNTDKRHAHIVVRGRDQENKKDIYIDPYYIKQGIRHICQNRATLELGKRTEHELKLERKQSLTAERQTYLDKQLFKMRDSDGVVKPTSKAQKLRLDKYLVKTGLAVSIGKSEYQLSKDMMETLYERGIKNDYIKRCYHSIKKDRTHLYVYKPGMKISGKVIENEVTNEFYEQRQIAVKDSKNCIYIIKDSNKELNLERFEIGQKVKIENHKVEKVKSTEKSTSKGEIER